jgi:starch synthase
MKKILFVSSEVHPLIKTGGLADVSGSLPLSLAQLGQDLRIFMPNYGAIKCSQEVNKKCTLHIDNHTVHILETRLPDSELIIWLLDYPDFFGSKGNPYTDEYGNSWGNTAERFALFSRVAVEIAQNRAQLNWQTDIVHCNDWQSGLVPALLSLEPIRPATVFTIHNMAYQGIFPRETFQQLNLPDELWNGHAIEFYGNMSFIKGGIACADHITTVSPTYALEIQTPEFGYALEGLLQYRHNELIGIINGIDLKQWSPENDTRIPQTFSVKRLAKKIINKTALQKYFLLPEKENIPVIGLISRLVDQKGINLVIDCLEVLVDYSVQFVLLGSGDKGLEHRLKKLGSLYPCQISIKIGYDEDLAHLIEAGADLFLMPSLFEPCGLNQLFSQRYGTLPIVRHTGGLADTVIDTLPETIADHTATGFVFKEPSVGALLETIKRALLIYANSKVWKQLQKNAMKKDFSWKKSAKEYLALYKSL